MGLLFACGQTGTSAEPIDPVAGTYYSEARFSPDGAALAVIVSHADDLPEELVTIDMATREPTSLAIAGTYLASPAWMPDGSAIIFTGDEGIYRIPAIGGTAELFLDDPFVTFAAMTPDISPDGSELIYSTNGGTMKRVDLATNQIEDTGIYGDSPRFAPNGAALAYIEDGAIVVVAETEPQPFLVDLSYLSELAWFPDSTRIAYTSNDGVSILDIQSGLTEIAHEGFALRDIDVSADGSTIIYTVNGRESLFLIDAP